MNEFRPISEAAIAQRHFPCTAGQHKHRTKGRRSMSPSLHPTKKRLLAAAVDFLESLAPENITVDLILQQTGISKGSLYHHFNDFYDLINTAMMSSFSDSVDESIDALSSIVLKSHDVDDFLFGLRQVTESTQSAATRVARFRRARLLALAEERPDLHRQLAAQQARLTSALAALFVEAQVKGWIRKDLDPMACAVFIQAYTFGKIIDDIVESPIEADDWCNLIMDVIIKSFLAENA